MTSVNRGSFNRNSPTQTGQTQDRDFNPQVLRNLNKFYTDQNQKRKGLFERKKNYCDYDDYDSLQSASDEPPTHITVTHTLPLASRHACTSFQKCLTFVKLLTFKLRNGIKS